MALPTKLVSDLAKLTSPSEANKSETTVYGTIVISNGSKYVTIDGSTEITPVTSTSNVKNGDRVAVMIKNHSAVVMGNITSPSASDSDLTAVSEEVTKMGILVADKASIKDLETTNINVQNLVSENVTIKGRLDTSEANISDLTAKNAEITGKLSAQDAKISNLETTKLSAEDADLKYANIDFTNIGQAAMEYFYSKSGLIENVTVGDQTITGNLVGVTISGDLIEGNTIKAEKLVIKGSDGLYYKLNTDGVGVTGIQTNENSLNGSVIQAKSITATQISVKDLVAFGATIGGFHITSSSLYSGSKSSVSNTTRGIYEDITGQIAIGDGINYLRYFKDNDGTYKLKISANSLEFYSSSNEYVGVSDVLEIANTANTAAEAAKKVATNYLKFNSDGLCIGDQTTTTTTASDGTVTTTSNLTGNTLINSSGIYIRNKTTILASFQSSTIKIGQNSEKSVIQLCNDKGRIYYGNAYISGTVLKSNMLQIRANDSSALLNLVSTKGINLYNGSKPDAAHTTSDLYSYLCMNTDNNSKRQVALEVHNTSYSVAKLTMNSSNFSLFAGGGSDGQASVIGDTSTHGLRLYSVGTGSLVFHLTTSDVSIKPYYEYGDSMNIIGWYNGVLTNSKKNVYFSIPLPKPTANVSTYTIAKSSFKITVRQNGKYIWGTSTSGATVYSTTIIKHPACLECCIVLDNDGTYNTAADATNNAPISIKIISGNISFS